MAERELITLVRLRRDYPYLFYAQSWFTGEPFMTAPLETPLPRLPDQVTCRGMVPTNSWTLPTAVQLAELYVRYPNAEVWQNWLWTSDCDQQGQRIYVGGVTNGKGFEIHRHLAITNRWCQVGWLT
jgi:hypothetical protein